jgi:hypothetical protein
MNSRFISPSFDLCCSESKSTAVPKPAYPWTNGPVERRNRLLKEATVLRYHYYLRNHRAAQRAPTRFSVVLVYNHAQRLKTLRGLIPREFGCAQYQKKPAIFSRDPARLEAVGDWVVCEEGRIFTVSLYFGFYKNGWSATDVHQLGEGEEIDLGQLTFAPKSYKAIKFSLCSSALLLPDRC